MAVSGDVTVSPAKGCELQPAPGTWWAWTQGPIPILWAKYPIRAWHKQTAGPRPDPDAGHPRAIRWFGFRAVGLERDPLQIPLVNFLLQIFSTESFDLEVHAAGLGERVWSLCRRGSELPEV